MVEIPVTGYQILGIIEKAEKDEIVKAAMELKNAEIENGYTAEVSTCRQALLVDVRDKLLFEQEYAGSIKEKVPPRSSLHIPWSWLPAALCVLQEVNVPNCLEAAFSKVPPSSDVFGVIVQDGCAGPRQSYVSKCMRSHSIEKRSTELDAVEEENEMKDENQNKEPLVLTKLSLRKLRAKLKETLIAHEEPLVSTKLSLRKLRAKLKETLIAHEIIGPRSITITEYTSQTSTQKKVSRTSCISSYLPWRGAQFSVCTKIFSELKFRGSR